MTGPFVMRIYRRLVQEEVVADGGKAEICLENSKACAYNNYGIRYAIEVTGKEAQ